MSAEKNASVFGDFDMVVSVSQETLNDQLRKLAAAGVIPSTLLLQRHLAANNTWTYSHLSDASAIERDANGNPTTEVIDATITPQIAITKSGTEVMLVLAVESGDAWLYGEVSGPLAQLNKYDPSGWSFAVSINLDLKAVEANDLGHGISVPDQVKSQLTGFLDQMFRVDHLFLDFDSVDLADFDASKTNPASGAAGHKPFVEFMQFYLRSLVKNGNPFILGYSVATTDHTAVPSNSAPASLQPAGTTFSVFHDPTDASRSSVNYVLVTRGGHKTITKSAPIFSSSWFDSGDQSAGKLVYSHSCLMEPLFLRPVFESVRDGVYKKLAGKVSVSKGNAYAAALKWADTGPNYSIADDWSGNDRYVNHFGATFSSDPATLTISLSGATKAYKHVEKAALFCKATASASGQSSWSGTIAVTASKGSDLAVTHNFTTTAASHDSNSNGCAKAMKFIGNLLGGIVDSFTFGADGGFFGTVFAQALSVDIPGVGDLSIALTNLAESVATVVVLPAGDVFDFSHPTSDANGNLAMDLSYR